MEDRSLKFYSMLLRCFYTYIKLRLRTCGVNVREKGPACAALYAVCATIPLKRQTKANSARLERAFGVSGSLVA